MKKSFEEMEVWKSVYQLGKELGAIFYQEGFRNYGFQDQIMRAVISITNNTNFVGGVMLSIAEGNNRGSAKDFIKFLFIAKGSCAEVQSMLYFAYDFGHISLEQRDSFLMQTMSIINQLGKFAIYLREKI